MSSGTEVLPTTPPADPSGGCKLVILVEGGVRELALGPTELSIGSADDSGLVLAHGTVSRRHAKVRRVADRYVIEDLGSTNGTFVNGARVREAYLAPGTTIHVGAVELRFEAAGEAAGVPASDRSAFGESIGRSRRMREIFAVLEKVSPTDATLVLEGETGTGKDVLARAIHRASARADAPFIVFDCSAVSETLAESELFGHERGAFTGAVRMRPGVFELAAGGTVFLDEIGELAPNLQPKLLRVLEQREIKRVGGDHPIPVDVRIIAATNRTLVDEVNAGRFRGDLFFRLSVVHVAIPALRERREDIPLLVKHFLHDGRFNRSADGGRRITHIDRAALDRLVAYEWPGNVRELRNVIERAVSLSGPGALAVDALPDAIRTARRAGAASVPPAAPPVRDESQPVSPALAAAAAAAGSLPEGAMLVTSIEGTYRDAKERVLEAFERAYVSMLLDRNDHNVSAAARQADMDRKHLRRLMSRYSDDDTEIDEREPDE